MLQSEGGGAATDMSLDIAQTYNHAKIQSNEAIIDVIPDHSNTTSLVKNPELR